MTDETYHIRFPRELVERIDPLVKKKFTSFGQVVREAVSIGLTKMAKADRELDAGDSNKKSDFDRMGKKD